MLSSHAERASSRTRTPRTQGKSASHSPPRPWTSGRVRSAFLWATGRIGFRATKRRQRRTIGSNAPARAHVRGFRDDLLSELWKAEHRRGRELRFVWDGAQQATREGRLEVQGYDDDVWGDGTRAPRTSPASRAGSSAKEGSRLPGDDARADGRASRRGRTAGWSQFASRRLSGRRLRRGSVERRLRRAVRAGWKPRRWLRRAVRAGWQSRRWLRRAIFAGRKPRWLRRASVGARRRWFWRRWRSCGGCREQRLRSTQPEHQW